MSKPKSDYTIQTVCNALRLLEVFHDEAELGVSELSRRLDLHKNNVFRLLATLELGGYVEQSSQSDRYRLGVRCLELAHAYTRSHTLTERSRPVLQGLVDRLGETAHLGVLHRASPAAEGVLERIASGSAAAEGSPDEFSVAHLDGFQPEGLLVTGSRVGKRLPVHCTALGKVLLGCADAETRAAFDRDVVSRQGLDARTGATFTDGHKLFEELRSVAGQGYALDLGECAEGLHCAAAPVFDGEGRVVAALSVSGPSVRLSEEGLHSDVAPFVAASAASLSKALGFQS
jgi:IclR family KDG regulon transcriptional repressor